MKCSEFKQVLIAGTWTGWARRSPWWSTPCSTWRTPAPMLATLRPSSLMTPSHPIEVNIYLTEKIGKRWQSNVSFISGLNLGGMKSESLWHHAGYAGYGSSPVNYGSIASPNLATNVIWAAPSWGLPSYSFRVSLEKWSWIGELSW